MTHIQMQVQRPTAISAGILFYFGFGEGRAVFLSNPVF